MYNNDIRYNNDIIYNKEKACIKRLRMWKGCFRTHVDSFNVNLSDQQLYILFQKLKKT